MVSESKRQIAHNLDRRQKSEAKLFPKKIMHNNKFATSIYSHVRHFVFDCFFFFREVTKVSEKDVFKRLSKRRGGKINIAADSQPRIIFSR